MTTVTIPGTGERFDLERPGALAAWNRALNRRYAMRNLEDHRSRMVRRIEARRRDRIATLVLREPFDRAVDLGAEDTTLTRAWARGGRRVFALDLDPALLAAHATQDGPEPMVSDAGRLPFALNSLDLAVLSAVLEHLPRPESAVAECARVVRPGGRIVAYVPWDRAVVPLKRWVRRFGFRLGRLHPELAPGHLHVFGRTALRRLFRPYARALRIDLDLRSMGYYVEARV